MLLKKDKNDWRGDIYVLDVCLPALTFRDLIDIAAANVGHDATPEQIKKEFNSILNFNMQTAREGLNNCIDSLVKAVKEDR